MESICAYCKKTTKKDKINDGLQTHGICPICKKIEMEKIKNE